MEKSEKGDSWRKTLDWIVAWKLHYAAFILSFALYILTKSVLFAVLMAVSLVALFVLDTVHSAQKTGWKHELKEILIAVLVAGAVWFGGGLLLQTSAPLDAIVSCSMLPNLERGDMMILQGGVARAPEVALSRAEFEANNWADQHLVCSLCGRVDASTGLTYNETCTRRFVPPVIGEEVDQSGNLVQYECGVCERRFANGRTEQIPCTKAILIKGRRIAPDFSNEVIVYTPARGDRFNVEIIHRVLVRLNVEGRYYYLTKGDNNDQLDMQWANSPIPQERVVGRAILRLPYIGYAKLFLFGMFATPDGCNYVMNG